MVRTIRCRTYSTISPRRVAAGSALIGIGAGCITSSRLGARGSSFDGTPGAATTGTTRELRAAVLAQKAEHELCKLYRERDIALGTGSRARSGPAAELS